MVGSHSSIIFGFWILKILLNKKSQQNIYKVSQLICRDILMLFIINIYIKLSGHQINMINILSGIIFPCMHKERPGASMERSSLYGFKILQ